MVDRILLLLFIFGVATGAVYFGLFLADRQEAREARNEELRAATRYLVWPAAAMALPIHTDRVEKTENFVIFTNLRTGSRIEMPLCSVRSIEEVSR